MSEDKSDHDLLIKLSTDMRWLMKQIGNHLHHHWMVTLAVLAAAFTCVVSAVSRDITSPECDTS